jgi:dTDP-4-dehydrorhamnose 3,5-epimerase
MKVTEAKIASARLIEIEPAQDERGFFARTWCRRELAAHGLDVEVVQESISYDARRATLRGLHFQRAPHEETKIVRCTRGATFDVIVDLRPRFHGQSSDLDLHGLPRGRLGANSRV